mmetsp:Transcript_18253/g.20653  ORF Transcript_18253/g.20653 Transcript_18253/m.20653 type:complete len:83 (+) Transcript_18253:114-362(+)
MKCMFLNMGIVSLPMTESRLSSSSLSVRDVMLCDVHQYVHGSISRRKTMYGNGMEWNGMERMIPMRMSYFHTHASFWYHFLY